MLKITLFELKNSLLYKGSSLDAYVEFVSYELCFVIYFLIDHQKYYLFSSTDNLRYFKSSNTATNLILDLEFYNDISINNIYFQS